MIYTTGEAAALLGIQPQAVARHIQRDNLKAEKRGRDYLITEEELERFKRERRGRGRPATLSLNATRGPYQQ